MTSEIRTRQLPGRQEALRLALGKPSTQLMKHIAGLDRTAHPWPPQPALKTFTATSGLEKLSPEERAALPF